jgi:hypothetical protein
MWDRRRCRRARSGRTGRRRPGLIADTVIERERSRWGVAREGDRAQFATPPVAGRGMIGSMNLRPLVMLFLILCMLPFWVLSAKTIRSIVRWVNRRDDPRYAKRPLDPP